MLSNHTNERFLQKSDSRNQKIASLNSAYVHSVKVINIYFFLNAAAASLCVS